MKHLSLKEAAEYLLSHNQYLILTHRRPDGDTIGSAAALCRGLRQLGKTAHILDNPQITERYRPYVEGLTMGAISPDQTVLSVDVAGREMLPVNAEDAEAALLLDHHGSNRNFAPQGIVWGDAAACGELIYALLAELGVTLDRELAAALYVAISTDTGCFRFSNTTANTFQVAARCLETGLDVYPINKEIFETVTFARLRLNAYLTDHLELLEEGRIALCFLPRDVEQELGLQEDDLEDVSNFARRIAGVKLAVTFRTNEQGHTKISVRCEAPYNAAELCGKLGGGGHVAAAGATLTVSQQEARQKVLSVVSVEP